MPLALDDTTALVVLWQAQVQWESLVGVPLPPSEPKPTDEDQR